MTFLEQYGTTIQFLTSICIPAFLVLGAFFAYRSIKSKISLILLASATLTLIASLAGAYFYFSMVGLSGIYTHSQATDADFEKFIKYAGISNLVSTLGFAIFAFAFVFFCCSIANIRKRNEELEFLTKELAERD